MDIIVLIVFMMAGWDAGSGSVIRSLVKVSCWMHMTPWTWRPEAEKHHSINRHLAYTMMQLVLQIYNDVIVIGWSFHLCMDHRSLRLVASPVNATFHVQMHSTEAGFGQVISKIPTSCTLFNFGHGHVKGWVNRKLLATHFSTLAPASPRTHGVLEQQHYATYGVYVNLQ